MGEKHIYIDRGGNIIVSSEKTPIRNLPQSMFEALTDWNLLSISESRYGLAHRCGFAPLHQTNVAFLFHFNETLRINGYQLKPEDEETIAHVIADLTHQTKQGIKQENPGVRVTSIIYPLTPDYMVADLEKELRKADTVN